MTPRREVPRDPVTGARLCEHCMTAEVPASLGTKPKRYCSRSCRQRAYEARKRTAAVRSAFAAGVEMERNRAGGTASSRDVPRVPFRGPGPKRYVASAQVERPDAAAEETVLPTAWRAPPVRRPLANRQSAVADPLPGMESGDSAAGRRS